MNINELYKFYIKKPYPFAAHNKHVTKKTVFLLHKASLKSVYRPSPLGNFAGIFRTTQDGQTSHFPFPKWLCCLKIICTISQY